MDIDPLAHTPRLTFTGVLVFTSVVLLGPGAWAHADGGSRLEGTWINDVKIVTCPSVPHAVLAAFQSMSTYMRGGVLIEGGGPA
jgi:hypothetical protein